MYWGWYKCIENDASNKARKIEAEIEIKIEDGDMQWLEDLLHLIQELKLNR